MIVANAAVWDYVDGGRPPFLVIRVRVYKDRRFSKTLFHVQHTPTTEDAVVAAIRQRVSADIVQLQHNLLLADPEIWEDQPF